MKLDINYIRYNKSSILNNTFISLNKGIVGIYGKNGKGKSTLLNVLSDFFRDRLNFLISIIRYNGDYMY